MSESSTGDSVSRSRTDRETEFSVFHTEMFPKLRSYANRMTGGWITGDDVAQEVLTKIYRSWDLIVAEHRVATAFKIAHDLVVSINRQRGSERKALRLWGAARPPPSVLIWVNGWRLSSPGRR